MHIQGRDQGNLSSLPRWQKSSPYHLQLETKKDMSGKAGSGLRLERRGRQFDWGPKGKCLLAPSETMGHREEF